MAYNYAGYNGWNQNPPYQYYPNYVYQNQTTIPQYSQQFQPPQQSSQTQQQNSGSIIWVQGEAGAKAYPVAPGNSVLLMDSENPYLYVKATDATGRPLPMETYELVKRDAQQFPISTTPATVTTNPVTKEDLMQYVKESELEAKVQELIKKALGE